MKPICLSPTIQLPQNLIYKLVCKSIAQCIALFFGGIEKCSYFCARKPFTALYIAIKNILFPAAHPKCRGRQHNFPQLSESAKHRNPGRQNIPVATLPIGDNGDCRMKTVSFTIDMVGREKGFASYHFVITCKPLSKVSRATEQTARNGPAEVCKQPDYTACFTLHLVLFRLPFYILLQSDLPSNTPLFH